MNQHAQINQTDPIMDTERLQEIVNLKLVAGDLDAILQEAAAEAAQRLALPIGLVSIVLDSAQHFAAMYGVDGWMAETRGTPVEWSFCAHTVRMRKPFVVEDAAVHPAVFDNPLVTQEGIRCYAGIPLISSRGHVLGSFCVLGTEARCFSEADIVALRELAARAIQQIETRRTAWIAA